MYIVGQTYSRHDIYEILRIPENRRGGDWLNGYHRHGSDYYIFCNVGTPGRTGDDYDNCWHGDRLIWYGKHRSNFEQQTVKNLISGHYRILIFWRESNKNDFIFAGLGSSEPDFETRNPVRIDWSIKPIDIVTP
nr:DUF3427 domain-containing protein [Wenzhouxiangella sp. XN79A]